MFFREGQALQMFRSWGEKEVSGASRLAAGSGRVGARGGLFRPFAPFAQEARGRSPQRFGASMEPPALVPLSFLGLSLDREKKLKCFGEGGHKSWGSLSFRARGLFSFWWWGSRPPKPAFRGSWARLRFLSKKRTKGRRPCWHHDAASLPLCSLSAACAPVRARSSLANTSFIFRFRASWWFLFLNSFIWQLCISWCFGLCLY